MMSSAPEEPPTAESALIRVGSMATSRQIPSSSMRQTVTIISRAVHLQSTQVTTRRQAFRRPISTETRESAMVLAPAKQSSIWVSMKSFQLPSEYENMATKAAKLKLTGKRLQLLGELQLWQRRHAD